MKFLIDAQLPPVLAPWLRERGHEAAHVQDVGLHRADDKSIWEHAQRENLIVVTKDEDFAARAQLTASAPLIVWLRVGNATNRALFMWIELRLPGIVELLEQGNRIIEVV